VSKQVVIHLDAVAHNVGVLRRASRPAEVMALVKADGFGHGAFEVASTALRHGASWIGVTSMSEALALRGQGIAAPMLIWLYMPDADLEPVLSAGVDVSVGSLRHLDAVADAADRAGRTANIHLKVDTGLGRNGATPKDWPELVKRAHDRERTGHVHVRALWSHLANAELIGDPTVTAQLHAFEKAVALAHAVGLNPPLRHIANSAAALHVPQAQFDLVRAGVSLYGVEPVPGRTSGLRATMTASAQVVEVIEEPPRLAVLPVGFADGMPRRASGGGEVLIGGTRRRVIGQIQLDHMTVDASDLSVRPGDRAVLFGPGDDGEPTIGDWAAWADTNPHEILTGLGSRLARRYSTGAGHG
jgi:alanine racemase